MENFSAATSAGILPGVVPGQEHSANHAFEAAVFMPGFDIVLRFLSKLGLDPSIFSKFSLITYRHY